MSKYDDYLSCPVCGSSNEILSRESIEYTTLECETKCEKCGHTDYWAFGHYESGEWFDMDSYRLTK